MSPSSLTISTPGRVCLFGEHQDYLHLPVIAAAISRRISIHGTVRPDDRMFIRLPDIGNEVSFSVSSEQQYVEERDYFRSALNVLRKHGHRFSRGYDCTVHGDIPINAGTSSSSALMVSWIHFLSHISDHPVPLSDEDIGKLAYEAEVLEFSEPGGMMDQYTTAIGGLIFLESHPQMKITRLNSSLGPFVLGNSNESKETRNVLRRVKDEVSEATRALRKLLPNGSFHTTSLSEFSECKSRLSKREFEILEATFVNRDITYEAKDILLSDRPDARKIGTLMNRHQEILRDILHISTPKIDAMIEAALKAGALGAKINGSGGGGCMFAFAPEKSEQVAEALGKIGDGMIITIDRGTHAERRDERT